MFPLLVVLSLIVLAAGMGLERAEAFLDEYSILAVMVPTMIGMGGNLGAILSSRLSTRFHLGTTELDPYDRVLWANVLAVLALAVTIFTTIAVGTYAIGLVIGSPLGFGTVLVISLVSGMSVAVIAIVFAFLTTYLSYRAGIDPDDTTIPIVTSVVDVFGMIIFLIVSLIVLG
jgi:mgtE-like transporter